MLQGIVLYHDHNGLDKGQQWHLFQVLVLFLILELWMLLKHHQEMLFTREVRQLALWELFSLPGASYSVLWALGWHKRNLISHGCWELGWFSHSFTIYKAEKILRNYEEFGWLLDSATPKCVPLMNTRVTTQHSAAWSQSRGKKCHCPVSSAFLWAEKKTKEMIFGP